MADRMSKQRGRVRRVIMAVVMAAVLFGLFRLVLYRVIAHQLQTAATQIPGCTGMRYDTLSIPYFSLQCDLQNVVLLFANPDDSITARSLSVGRWRTGKVLPRALDVTIHDLLLDARHPVLAPLRHHLLALDLDKLTISADLSWMREGAQEELWTVKALLEIAETAQISIALLLDKVNARGVALALENPVNWLLVVSAARLVTANGRYEDRGLLGRAVEAAAHRQGRRPEEIRRAVMRETGRRARAAQEPQVRTFWRVLSDVSRQPVPLMFETRLMQPLPLVRLLWVRRLEDAVRSLNLEVRAAQDESSTSGVSAAP